MDVVPYHSFTPLLTMSHPWSKIVILHMNFLRPECTHVYIRCKCHIRLFMTVRDVWLPYTSYPTVSKLTVLSTSLPLTVSHSLVSHFVLCKQVDFRLLLHFTITPVSRCFHPLIGAIGVPSACKGPTRARRALTK